MAKYRKKPVVIEAYQWNNRRDNLEDAPEWLKKAHALDRAEMRSFFVPMGSQYAEIVTLEGRMRANPGDWIIQGVKGELYPCKPDIFEATYQPVDT